jgi:S-adenosylmethionine:tRNA ribosyltransferase-isomerase
VNLRDFDYPLPPSAIAQCPAPRRDAARLLVIDRARQSLEDRAFADLPTLLHPGDCVVVNNSRVLPARVLARTAAGAEVELLFVEAETPSRWRALVRPGRRCREGTVLHVEGAAGGVLRVAGVTEDGARLVERPDGTIDDLLATHGRPPLPPYIAHHATPSDEDAERYQTVYARHPGSVAAPTAGLHFTDALLDRLRGDGVEVHELTLHVGPATFQPIRTPRVEAHTLAAERIVIPETVAAAVTRARQDGRRVVAVGTTTTRALEGCADPTGVVAPSQGRVGLFITPGHRFRVVGALVTNFHLPRSSLLVLVSAFAGRELILKAYAHALRAGYRFYSYGDACLIA